eukprot:CAMPEP_0118929584 /NCGR_PEP_ID=MMETSP1169-20130426/6537_1 /TAXON_ID=36882 /ORGANISM="Pyramimonas obovata, Strain CCMP722" /LENGTH=264 /DNA_ID=CAMNT_0006871799 /DNA_START=168 /DNA_END=959 /DNA_ORIENTATION=+
MTRATRNLKGGQLPSFLNRLWESKGNDVGIKREEEQQQLPGKPGEAVHFPSIFPNKFQRSVSKVGRDVLVANLMSNVGMDYAGLEAQMNEAAMEELEPAPESEVPMAPPTPPHPPSKPSPKRPAHLQDRAYRDRMREILGRGGEETWEIEHRHGAEDGAQPSTSLDTVEETLEDLSTHAELSTHPGDIPSPWRSERALVDDRSTSLPISQFSGHGSHGSHGNVHGGAMGHSLHASMGGALDSSFSNTSLPKLLSPTRDTREGEG